MNNPYEVLGVSEDASQDEIRSAYKKLVKKYHPDQYANNPLSDLAQEKIKEINAAYDALTKRGGGSNYGSSSGGQATQSQSYRGQSSGSSQYNEIRRNIQMNNLTQAEQILNTISTKDAEWNFLKGVIALRKGWHDQAFRYIKVANGLDPSNPEYRSALNNLNGRNNAYRQQGDYRGYNRGGSFCGMCGRLLLADCCCECMGGDLIACC